MYQDGKVVQPDGETSYLEKKRSNKFTDEFDQYLDACLASLNVEPSTETPEQFVKRFFEDFPLVDNCNDIDKDYLPNYLANVHDAASSCGPQNFDDWNWTSDYYTQPRVNVVKNNNVLQKDLVNLDARVPGEPLSLPQDPQYHYSWSWKYDEHTGRSVAECTAVQKTDYLKKRQTKPKIHRVRKRAAPPPEDFKRIEPKENKTYPLNVRNLTLEELQIIHNEVLAFQEWMKKNSEIVSFGELNYEQLNKQADEYRFAINRNLTRINNRYSKNIVPSLLEKCSVQLVSGNCHKQFIFVTYMNEMLQKEPSAFPKIKLFQKFIGGEKEEDGIESMMVARKVIDKAMPVWKDKFEAAVGVPGRNRRRTQRDE